MTVGIPGNRRLARMFPMKKTKVISPRVVFVGRMNSRLAGVFAFFFALLSVAVSLNAEESELFSDNFNDGSADGWTSVQGNWSVQSNQYVNTAYGLSTAGDSDWTDYYIEVNVRPEFETYTCVIGRVQDTNNFYQLEVHEPNDELGLWKNVNGSWSQIASYSTAIDMNTWYLLKLQMEGSTIKGFLDGVERISIVDTTFSAGKIALRSGNDSRFDDVRVFSVEGGIPQVAAPQLDPEGGIYISEQNVTITCLTAGASIRYTTDGSTPTSTTGALYTGPVAIASSATFRAIAYADGMADSTVTSATYTINIEGSRDYFVDPATGSMSNPGTAEQPWSTLAEVFGAGKVFNPGDVIHLLSGDHGFPVITGDNTEDVTIIREAGHQPVINGITFSGARHWVLKDVAVFIDAVPPKPAILEHPAFPEYESTLVRITGGSSGISLVDCDVSSIEDSSLWTADDWNKKAWNGLFINGNSRDILIDGCLFLNVNFGIKIDSAAEYVTVANSRIQNFCGDGIQIACNHVTVTHNVIADCYDTNGNHDDGIQGLAQGTGVVVSGNLITSATSDRPLMGYLQGLAFFDGWFDDFVFENNIIAVGHWHGISLYGARNCRVVNNTVVKNPLSSSSMTPWIRVWPHKNGQASAGNLVRNNLTSGMSNATGIGTVDHNLVTTDYTAHFVDYVGSDFHLKSDSAAIGAGSAVDAPVFDFDGETRSSPPDVGADEYIAGRQAYGLEIVENEQGKFVNSDRIGWLFIEYRPWVWSYFYNRWLYLPMNANFADPSGLWMYVPR